MLEQARKGNIADPPMVNTATKIIRTAFREDKAEFAGSKQTKPEGILNLPHLTFSLHVPALLFGRVADAVSIYTCGKQISAAQQVSPNRSINC